MSYIALYQGTASEAAEKVRNADSSWAEAHSEWQEERTCTAHLKVRPFKTHGKCLFSAASKAVILGCPRRHDWKSCPVTNLFLKQALVLQSDNLVSRNPHNSSKMLTIPYRR